MKAVIFDIDGTILDTKEYIFQTYEHVFHEHGLPPMTRDELAVYMGGTAQGNYQELTGYDNVEELLETHRAFQEQHQHLAAPFPRAFDVLFELKERGVAVGAVSSRKQSVFQTLENAGLLHYFRMVVTGDEVTRHKPDPEGVFLVLGALRATPFETLLVGDTREDILTGKAAGTGTAGVTYGFHARDELAALEPDYLFDRLEEVLEVA